MRRIEFEPRRQVGPDADHVADPPRCGNVAGVPDQRIEAHPDGLHAEQLPPPGLGNHLAGLAGVQGERLLEQDRLARAEGQQRVLVVLTVGRGDVDDVEVRVGDQLGVGAVGAVRAEAVGQRGRPFAASRAHRHDLVVRRLGDLGTHHAGDAPGAEDAPPDRISHIANLSPPARPSVEWRVTRRVARYIAPLDEYRATRRGRGREGRRR